jgi:hypothetical protein
MEPIAFTSKLERREFLAVAVTQALRNPLSLTAMASGPVLWLVGYLTGGMVVRSLAMSLMFLIVAVPAAGWLAGAYAAYRPSAGELFVSADWVFSSDGVRIRQEGQDAFADWDEFYGWRKVGRAYLLHTSRRYFVVLPVLAVPADRRADFEDLLTAHMRAMG